MAIDINARVRESFEELWHKGNLDFIDQRCTPDFRCHDVLVGVLDREGLKQHVRTMRTAFPDLRFRIDEILTSGDSVAVRWTATGTNRGELMGNPPTNRGGSVEGMEFIRMSGEKQREMWVNWDVFGMLRNLGLAPQQGMPVGTGMQPASEPAKPGAGAPRRQ
jgi:predicted ester cyclase